MKKTIAILMAFMLILSMTACMGNKDNNDNMTNNNGSSQNGTNNDMNNGTNNNGNNGNMNGTNGNNNMNGDSNMNGMAIEDLTEAEKETLRSQIDAMDGLTFGDIRFEGTKAMVTLESTLDEIGDDVRESLTNIIRALRGNVSEVQIVR